MPLATTVLKGLKETVFHEYNPYKVGNMFHIKMLGNLLISLFGSNVKKYSQQLSWFVFSIDVGFAVRLERFRALKHSWFKSFRALKC